MIVGAIQQDASPVWYRGAADVQLFFCPDVIVRGHTVPPGLLLGTLDFDLREVAINEPIYRLWWNSIGDRGNQDNLLISQGTVTNIDETYGFQNTPAYNDSTCVNQGASGSPGMSVKWQRILIGPLDSGGRLNDSNLPCTVGTRGSKGHSIFEKFFLDPGLYSVQISTSTISSLGLAWALYTGWQDKNRNYVFDIQEDYERVHGEINRDHYWYNFDSRHQNEFWRTFGGTQIYPDNLAPTGPPYGIAHLEAEPVPLPAPPGGPTPVSGETLLRNDSFPLQPNSTYRVNLKLLRVDSAGSSQALQFSGPSVPPQTIQTTVSQNPVRVTFRFTTGPAPLPGIRFDATAPIRADIETLSIIQEGSVMDFDSADKRGGWRNEGTSGRALIIPDGVTSTVNAAPDFALAVGGNDISPNQCVAECHRSNSECLPDCEESRDLCLASAREHQGPLPAQCVQAFNFCKVRCAPALATCEARCGNSEDWSAMNEHLALVPGDSYRICFMKKSSNGSLNGRSEVSTAAGTVLSSVDFSASSGTWDNACLPQFTAQPESRLRFGLRTAGREHILVDNITINRE
jgi:hypothetical protein